MQNMVIFTFTKKDLLNSPLLPSHHLNSSGISYTLSTTTGLLGRNVTTLASSGGFSMHTLLSGAINWRKRRFEIGGVQRKWSILKCRTGLFSRCVPLYIFFFFIQLMASNGQFTRVALVGGALRHQIFTSSMDCERLSSFRDFIPSDRLKSTSWATCSSLRHSPSAVLSTRRFHIFRKSEPATIAFASDVPQKDIIFLTLVMVYSEMKRKKDEVCGVYKCE